MASAGSESLRAVYGAAEFCDPPKRRGVVDMHHAHTSIAYRAVEVIPLSAASELVA